MAVLLLDSVRVTLPETDNVPEYDSDDVSVLLPLPLLVVEKVELEDGVKVNVTVSE